VLEDIEHLNQLNAPARRVIGRNAVPAIGSPERRLFLNFALLKVGLDPDSDKKLREAIDASLAK
jgi:hypothetical protein